MRICLITPAYPPLPNGIGDYSARLAEALSRQREVTVVSAAGTAELNCPIRLVVPPDASATGLVRATAAVRPDVVLFQYNPFSYGWKGLGPSYAILPTLLQTRYGIPVVTVFHELFFPFGRSGAKGLVWAIAQRLQCLVLGQGSRAMVATTGARTEALRRWFPGKRHLIERIPVGTTIPVRAISEVERRAVRSTLGADDDTLLLGTMGSVSGGVLAGAAIEAVAALRHAGITTKLALLGRAAASPHVLSTVENRARRAGIGEALSIPGGTTPGELSHQLSALDLFLGIYDDGISGRRTSVASALAHDLPIVGIAGANTDLDWFRPRETVHLARSSSPEHLAQAIGDVALDQSLRERLRAGSRTLHNQAFAWPVIAGRVSALAQQVCDSAPDRLPR